MNFLDLLATFLPLALVLGMALHARKYVHSVADFLSANRMAGRYLLCIAGGEMQAGAVVFVAAFEAFQQGGFAYTWWGFLLGPVLLIVKISGFVVYRFRQTRAMTLAQFFEIRYNKSFRVFTGCLGFFAGLLNFGVIPAIGARVLVYFLNLPETVSFSSISVPTYMPLMAIFLTITVFVALSGGVVTVMMVNTAEGILSQLFYLVIIVALLSIFTWSEMHSVLVDRAPGMSLVNPFDTSGVKDFNLWNLLMMLALIVYGTMSWQNASAYNSAGLTPHEGRMAGILTNWRDMGKNAVVVLLALCAMTYLHHEHFAQGAEHVHLAVQKIADSQAREEMEAPIALAYLLPAGVKGLFCAILLMGIFGGDATHLHSWGSIFVQDVLVPLRKRPFSPQSHLWFLRCAIVGVALFAFIFGCLFQIADYVNMWWSITQAIFTGGAGSAIIGGLYWRKGTAAGAWAAFIVGSALTVGGIITQEVFSHYHQRFALNGVQISFYAMLISIATYVLVSFITCKRDFDLDQMLHRKPALPGIMVGNENVIPAASPGWWDRVIGLDEDFSRADRWIAIALFGWSMLWVGVFIGVSIWNLVAPWPTERWVLYYYYTGIGLPILFALVTGIWFTWGGIKDIRLLFARLKDHGVSASDDGTVVNHHNLDEV